jgi:hypothetical protein
MDDQAILAHELRPSLKLLKAHNLVPKRGDVGFVHGSAPLADETTSEKWCAEPRVLSADRYTNCPTITLGPCRFRFLIGVRIKSHPGF